MAVSHPNWTALESAPVGEVTVTLFNYLREIAIEIQTGDPDDPSTLQSVPRIAELVEQRGDLEQFQEVLSATARALGLWNYIDRSAADSKDRLVAESVTSERLGGIALHREQIKALNTLLAGRNLILSAPTSFGKSLLIDALLLTGRYKRVAIVLPTLALLDEFRRRLAKRFGEQFQIVMHSNERATSEKTIFLGTQERLIGRSDATDLDLVVVDEFYKLDPARKDERSVTLNAAVYGLLKESKQFFFLGPNIEGVQTVGESGWSFEFLKTRFSTVAVDTFDLKNVANKEQRLAQEAYDPKNWPALIFVSSPKKANELAAALVEPAHKVGNGEPLASWIEQYFGGKWALSEAVSKGIGIHHGRMPRALASRFVTLFNNGTLPIMVCTSTLIEGVNTAAKSVLIYDKTINRAQFDFFTYSNIKGRAGRLGQHHTGQVFLFHAPPAQENVEVAPPLFGDLDAAPAELLVHIKKGELSPLLQGRVSQLQTQLKLSSDELRRLAPLGLDNLLALQRHVRQALSANLRLGWSGYPRFEEIEAVCTVLAKVRNPREFGAFSARQLAFYLNQLRSAPTMREFFVWYSKNYRGDLHELDNVFRFLRACEYSLPEYFGAVEAFVRSERRTCDYSQFIAGLPRWFRADALKNLEEEGVPIQISERFLQHGDDPQSLRSRLRAVANSRDARMSDVEREWVLDAIPN
ncbi:DEAD/DEAH box helicase [Terricaulis sp.]|uniref:DEAD/DEAH box helicase n=1 Tax=Terricaulis sp. TaxID=2768686 RepID=UPI002AC79B9F|nr:DEAD/DEAH box helicase [Terricaulis sp.]MDZ4691063.1 helicase-related protein [Terricaulis sp.]